ncbi:MAG: efflux RND transporter permease subunit [Burkholderiaceae bacterium]|nr:efflux RND transporter permease subunit [Burkholderiaceae bacterium]
MSRFFIGRPIFAWVIAIVIMLAGVLSITRLPVSQYPQIAPPQVTVTATYPGASAETIENTITQQVEQAMTGLDGYLYMASNSDSTGRVSINITFEAGTDPDIAQVQVQNKLKKVESSLPQVVQKLGVSVEKSSANFLMVVGFVDKNGKLNETDLSDYLVNNVQEPLSRVQGVGEVEVFGSSYAMRIWLDPEKLNKYNLSAYEIVSAIEEQNVQVPVGQVGNFPSKDRYELNAIVNAMSLLETVEDFEQIMVKTNTDGSRVLMKDVARVEMGSESYHVLALYNGLPSTGMAIKLASGANAMDTSDAVKAALNEMSDFFPEGVEWVVPYDTTPFVRISIEEVIQTLCEAIVLVVFVMFLFLQNWRATLIPTIAVPVVLLGTFGVLAALGYSINVLTMFAMVLAIGLLVDDAIVVVENVERVMRTENLHPREATIKSMEQITGALIGIAMVLSAVFVPMAFFGGSTGVIYRQFAVTIVASMTLSVLVALILTPALCATMLKPIDAEHHDNKQGFFGNFNRGFERFSHWVRHKVGQMAAHILRCLAIYAVIIGGMVFGFQKLPSSFMPGEDQGVLLVQMTLPQNASQQQTQDVLARVRDYFETKEKATVESVFTISGFSFGGTGQNTGLAFIRLKDWDERPGEAMHVNAIAGRAMGTFAQWMDAKVYAFPPPAIPELGMADGFDVYLQAKANQTHEELIQTRNMFLGMANGDSRLTMVRPNGMEDTPQLRLVVDTQKVRALGISLSEVNATLTTVWASSYVNDFLDRGRVKKVYVQGDTQFRQTPEDLGKWYVKNNRGEMVPFSAFSKVEWDYGSPRLERFNGLSAVNIQGNAAPGFSSGDAMAAVQELAQKLPAGYGISWTGVSYQEKESAGQAAPLYALSILVVFLCLAALYESWSIPAAVIMVIPMGVIGALALTALRGLNNDIYFQVGLVTTIGLVSKNAILIVEFAKELHDRGEDIVHAAIDAVRLRLRPIVMTSLAFGLGVLPLAMASGAGSGAQNAIGWGVLGGMITGTFLCVLFVPIFYVMIMKFTGNANDHKIDIHAVAEQAMKEEEEGETVYLDRIEQKQKYGDSNENR